MTRAEMFAELSNVAWRDAEEAARSGDEEDFEHLVALSDHWMSIALTNGYREEAA